MWHKDGAQTNNASNGDMDTSNTPTLARPVFDSARLKTCTGHFKKIGKYYADNIKLGKEDSSIEISHEVYNSEEFGCLLQEGATITFVHASTFNALGSELKRDSHNVCMSSLHHVMQLLNEARKRNDVDELKYNVGRSMKLLVLIAFSRCIFSLLLVHSGEVPRNFILAWQPSRKRGGARTAVRRGTR